MMNKVILEQSGIDYSAGISRFLGDRDLYEEMLTAFLSDDCFSKVKEAFDSRDYKKLLEHVHSMKGASSNLDMVELYHASSELTEYLRNGEEPEASVVALLFDKMKSAYIQVIDGIRSAI